MKKVMLLAMLCLATVFGINPIPAQETLEFKGIPIEGDLKAFLTKLQNEGFSMYMTLDDGAVLNGKFTGYDVVLYVFCTPKSRQVTKVCVFYPERSSWSSLKSDYENMVSLYKKKYVLDAHFEYFKSPYEEGDGYELTAVMSEKCSYVSFFKPSIMIEITKYKQLEITYENSVNMDKAKEEWTSSNLNDI